MKMKEYHHSYELVNPHSSIVLEGEIVITSGMCFTKPKHFSLPMCFPKQTFLAYLATLASMMCACALG